MTGKHQVFIPVIAGLIFSISACRAQAADVELSKEELKTVFPAFQNFEGAENYAVVSVDTAAHVNIREGAGTSCLVTAKLENHGLCHIRGKEGNWYLVESGEAKGYIREDFLITGEEAWMEVHASGEENMPCAVVLDEREKLVEYACQFVGNPYVWGGTSLTEGVDCSGFTQQVYASMNIELPHQSGLQSGCGTQIPVEDAQPGDLIFYAENNRIYHVVIYIGNGQAVHAGSVSTGIHISDVSYEKAVCAVSLL